ncbi:MAG: SIMPL domain-containing protein [Rhodospirillales bacterium]
MQSSTSSGPVAVRRALAVAMAATILAVGLVIAGWLIGRGFAQGRQGERFVSVKGVAEREVKADLALWPLRYVATGNDLVEVQRKIAADGQRVRAFLAAGGLEDEAISVQDVQVIDLLAQTYRSGPIDSRFIVAETLMVRTLQIDRVLERSGHLGDLVAAGVVLGGQEGGAIQGPLYLFTRLNEIKPPMIEEATRSARAAAVEFARQSQSRIEGIRRANQGLFQILPRDEVPGASEQSQVDKVVRVVSTIDYTLTD